VSATVPVIRSKTAALSLELERSGRLREAALAARARLRDRRNELDGRRAAFAALEREAIDVARRRGSRALGAGDVALALEERVEIAERSAPSKIEAMRLANELAALGPVPLRPIADRQGPALRYRLPADAPVTDGVGAVSPSGVRSRGMTIATRRGAPLAVPASGTILFAGPFRDYDGVIIIDHGGGWKSVIVDAGTRLQRGARVRIGEPLGIALGPVEVQLQHNGEMVSPALIAGSSAILSNRSKGG
jgi:septal ring factor EnvC (AmiA/AmiB activator)